MKKYITKIKEGFVFSITASIVFISIGIIYASLNSVEPGDTLTANKWNELVGKVNNLDSINGDYSTEEIFTGNYWIDGKKIYKKTIETGALPNNSTKYVAHGISGLEFVIKIYGHAKKTSTNVYYSLPHNFPQIGTDNSIGVMTDNTSIYLITGNDRTAINQSYVTIEYTKTTD